MKLHPKLLFTKMKIYANPLRLRTVLPHHVHRNSIGTSETGRH